MINLCAKCPMDNFYDPKGHEVVAIDRESYQCSCGCNFEFKDEFCWKVLNVEVL